MNWIKKYAAIITIPRIYNTENIKRYNYENQINDSNIRFYFDYRAFA